MTDPTLPSKSSVDREALARALYETSYGTNGYPPLYKSISWDEIHDRRLEYERADKIIAKLAEGRS